MHMYPVHMGLKLQRVQINKHVVLTSLSPGLGKTNIRNVRKTKL